MNAREKDSLMSEMVSAEKNSNGQQNGGGKTDG